MIDNHVYEIIGKTIKNAIDDFDGLWILFTDGSKLIYNPSDGGYSSCQYLEAEENWT